MHCNTPTKFAPLVTSTLRPDKRKCSHQLDDLKVVRRSFLKTEDNKRRYSLAMTREHRDLAVWLNEPEVETPKPAAKRLRRNTGLSINKWLETREFPCHVCDKRFFHKSAQVAHSLTHTSTPPLKRRNAKEKEESTTKKTKSMKTPMKSLVKRLKLKLSR